MPPKRGSRRGRGRGAKAKGAAAVETPEPDSSQEALDVSAVPSEGTEEETTEPVSQEAEKVPTDVTTAPELDALSDTVLAPEVVAPSDVTSAPEPVAPSDVSSAPEPVATSDATLAPEPVAPSDVTSAPEPVAPSDVTLAPELVATSDVTSATEPVAPSDVTSIPEPGIISAPESDAPVANAEASNEQESSAEVRINEQQADNQESSQPIVIEEKATAKVSQPPSAPPIEEDKEEAEPESGTIQSNTTEPAKIEVIASVNQKPKEQENSVDIDHSNQSQLVQNGVNADIAVEIGGIISNGLLTYEDISAECIELLKNYPTEHIGSAVKEFSETDFAKISDKGAHLLSILKAWEENKTENSSSSGGPNEAKIKEMLERTGYKHEVTSGQRLYGPPANWKGEEPTHHHEVFIGKIPPDVFEDDLVPLCEECGKLYDIRIKIDPQTGNNRGFAFVRFAEKEAVKLALEKLNDYEIRPRKQIKVNVSTPNMRLYVGNIPKNKSKQEIMDEFSKITENVKEVIVYASVNDEDPMHTNRGFCFLQFHSHSDAANARRILLNPETRVFGTNVRVNWADAVDEDVNMEGVKNLYIRNLSSDVTEEILREKFGAYGPLEKVKRVRDFAFVHYEKREDALSAMKELDGTTLGKCPIEVTLARPVSDRAKQKREMRNVPRWGMNRGGFAQSVGGMGRGGWFDYGRAQGYAWGTGPHGWPQRPPVGNFYRGRGGPVGIAAAPIPSYQPYGQPYRGFGGRPGFGRGGFGGGGFAPRFNRGGGGAGQNRGTIKRKANEQVNQSNGASEAKRNRQEEAAADGGDGAAQQQEEMQASGDQDWTNDVAGSW